MLEFDEWLLANENMLSEQAAETGADRELDFDSERYAERKYDAYVKMHPVYAILDDTKDVPSFERYGKQKWMNVIQDMLGLQFNKEQVCWVLRSNHMALHADNMEETICESLHPFREYLMHDSNDVLDDLQDEFNIDLCDGELSLGVN